MTEGNTSQEQTTHSTLDEMWSLFLMGRDPENWDDCSEEEMEDPNHGWWTDED